MSLTPELKERLVSLQLFDADWYLQQYRDVRESDLSAWHHFVNHGLEEGRQPGPKFDPNAYVQANPDVRLSGLSALHHYLQSGYLEGRPLTRAEKKAKDATGSVWRESPLPPGLPNWFGGFPEVQQKGVVRLLYVLSVQSGGTPQTNQDLMTALLSRTDTQIECFVLRCFGVHMVLYLFQSGIYVPLERYQLTAPVPAFPHLLAECDAQTKQWLANYRIDLIHVRHSAWQSLGLMDVACQLDIPVLYSFHDYYAVCPSVKLLDENDQFCAGRCTQSAGECRQELWEADAIKPLKHASVYLWQQQFAGALGLCSGFLTTTTQVRDIMWDIFPALQSKLFEVIPHGRHFDTLADLAVAPCAGEPLRVVLPGHIARSKGGSLLHQLARDKRLQHVEWHVLGTLEAESGKKMQEGHTAQWPENIIVHGPYRRDEFNQHIAYIRPHLGAVLSIWPETWCHTLTELWAAGLPVVGFDLGAVGERLKETGAGWVAEDCSVESVASILVKAHQQGEWLTVKEKVAKWQSSGQRSCMNMADEYWRFYQGFLSIDI